MGHSEAGLECEQTCTLSLPICIQVPENTRPIRESCVVIGWGADVCALHHTRTHTLISCQCQADINGGGILTIPEDRPSVWSSVGRIGRRQPPGENRDDREELVSSDQVRHDPAARQGSCGSTRRVAKRTRHEYGRTVEPRDADGQRTPDGAQHRQAG